METIIGLDIGSSGCRAVSIDTKGQPLKEVGVNFKTTYQGTDQAYQDIDEIVVAVMNCLKKSVSCNEHVQGIVLGSVFHSTSLADKDLKPLTPLIPWLDTRAKDLAQSCFESRNHTYAKTACPPNSAYPIYKLLWYYQNQPELIEKANYVLGIKEYVVKALTGSLAVDNCVASGSGLFDIYQKKWDIASLNLCGLHFDMLPPNYDITHSFPLLKGIATELGLKEGLPVILGGGDGLMASLGVGAVQTNDVAMMIGTSAACRTFVEQPLIDSPQKARTWCYYLTDEIWAVGTSINNGGSAFSWLINNFIKQLGASFLKDDVNIIKAYSAKLDQNWTQYSQQELPLVIPFLLSERGPFWDATLKAELYDLSFKHNIYDIGQSIIFGINHLVLEMVKMIEDVAGSRKKLFATGGFSELSAWKTDLATLLQQSIYFPEIKEAAAYGAALLGLKALGYQKDIKDLALISKGEIASVNEKFLLSRQKEYQRFKKKLGKIMN